MLDFEHFAKSGSGIWVRYVKGEDLGLTGRDFWKSPTSPLLVTRLCYNPCIFYCDDC